MRISSKDFRVPEGDEVNLKKWPTKVEPVYKSKEQYKELFEEHVAQLSSRRQLLYASNRYALLLIFQAMDAAGKDGAIRHVISGFNPQGCQVFSYKHPSGAELEHDFLWRTTRNPPESGKIGIFNRSYYEGGADRPRAPQDSAQRGLSDVPQRREDGLARPPSFDCEFGRTPPRERDPHHHVLSLPLQRRTVSGSSRASTKKTRTGNSVKQALPREDSGNNT
jgi:hypothetical protein